MVDTKSRMAEPLRLSPSPSLPLPTIAQVHQLTRQKKKPSLSLTDAELTAYDGTTSSLPILLALNGTIYDVSSSPATYGPGGSYHFFAGKDAARAFLTGCFREDAVPDLRGVERMYMPVEPWEKVLSPAALEKETEEERAEREGGIERGRKVVGKMSKGDLKVRKEREAREARRKVVEGLEHWHVLFRGDKGKKYRKVGEVKREEGWWEKRPVHPLCERAEEVRPVREYPA